MKYKVVRLEIKLSCHKLTDRRKGLQLPLKTLFVVLVHGKR